jgi:hypothetical protein
VVLGPLGGDDFAMLGWLFGAIVVDREMVRYGPGGCVRGFRDG